MMKNAQINWLAVLAVVVISQVIPAIWYGLFAKTWMAGNNMTEAQAMSAAVPMNYLIAALYALVAAYLMLLLMDKMGINTAIEGAKLGLLLGGLAFGGMMLCNIFSIRPFNLTLIDGGNNVAIFTAAGAILGGWQKKT